MGVLTFYDNFRRRIARLLEGGFSDAILLVDGVEIPVHKCILAVQSEYFSHLFSTINGSRQTTDQRGAMSSSQAIVERSELSTSNNQSIVEIPLNENVFELKDTKVEVVRAVMDYFYRGEYDFDDNVETHLLSLELANQFGLSDLEEILLNNLAKSITVENFVHFYNMKMRYKNDLLENSCVTVLTKNGEDIAKSDNFSKLNRESLLSLLDEESFTAPEIDIFRAAERWAGVNKPNTRTAKDIVDKIRLATMSQKDLFEVVERSKEFPSIDILGPIRSVVNKDAASKNIRQHRSTPVTDLKVANLSLVDELVKAVIIRKSLIFGSKTSHNVGGISETTGVKSNKSHSSPDQIISVASTNVVLASRGATVTGGYSSMNCINGDVNKCALMNENSPLIITLGQPYWLSSVRVRINVSGNSYTIGSSPDGKSWQPVGGELKGEDGVVWRTFEFSRRVVLNFRITMKQINPDKRSIATFHFESPASTIAVTN